MDIKKVVVIGSGTMGSGIAAQVANAGIPVFLLDLPSSEGTRNKIVENAKERIANSRPPLLVEKSKIDLIHVGNIEDNFNLVGEADWVVEAVVERIDIKHSIYKKIEDVRKPESVISSNTSTIPLKVLSENMSDEMKQNFCITHFFNPVRYMGLLEIVTEPINDKEKINLLKSFCDEKLGKGVIICKDTPGFLGNRVGVYAMQVAMTEAFKMGLTIEEADAVFGRPMGIPKTGVFGLYDLIGIDLMSDVLKSFIKELPKDDPFHEVAQEKPLITKLISDGYTGRKGKGGFYRINKEGEKKVLESINLKTGEYSKTKKVDLETETLDFIYLINRIDKFGEYAWSVLSKIILYASSLIPKVTDEYNNIDEAMRLGFNWTIGPFEILDKIGIEFFAERDQNLKLNRFLNNLYLNKRIDWYSDKQLYLKHDLRTLRRRSNIYWLKADVKKNENLIFNSAKIYTSETEGYNIVEFTTKANTLDSDSMYALSKATEKNLIIINDALQFSAGVNLNYVMEFAKQKEWRKIQKFIFDFQQTCKKLKYSEFPVIAAPSGLAIGGGFEVVCQSDYVVSHTNVVLGLVETLVGLIPAGGGCKEMLWRWMQTDESKKDLNFAPLKVFDLIGYAKTASSPNEAIPNKFLLDKDRVVINRDMLLHESEKLLLQINKDYKPPAEPTFKLSGANVRDKMYEILETLYKDKKILDHGLEVGKQLAFVLSGGNTNLDKELSEDDLYALELDAFMNLIQMPKTQERIKHTLETGKPLVN
ncbi:MAG: putative 3-hydroxyacyl-CoA dehydrogenase [Alphaproteobacteria bacterium MarineAlpha5_Bin2]|jgi:3-hydroxyacyl-CoA dehydrogenase|nr:3-hydroxyacyl-CoA dehydrogenase/enoyl-CoA hydratase family protein [Alphaproteobacteria bacterium]PPR54213.1 MAG: putative 3-hydroxyacyl-CoA dehydrogenase [Alphaproteobacteria bacterium MarineAlpha5_Bin2]HIC41596.1 3-hydroxyacyl-CoA dehydrogenase/enoyl-CoA hydratase family protein [Pelagibacterales bacterium]